MTDFRTAGSIGERIQAARKARGMSARELAEAIGGVPTQSTIENIELGRKASIDIVQLLNIAMALRLPISYLLAPMGAPARALDLVGLSADFSSMTALEFDAWLSSANGGARVPVTLDERNAMSELQALRDWTTKIDEIHRLEAALELERSAEHLDESSPSRVEDRLESARRESDRLLSFLRSAGWSVSTQGWSAGVHPTRYPAGDRG